MTHSYFFAKYYILKYFSSIWFYYEGCLKDRIGLLLWRISLFPAMTPKALAHFISIIIILWLQDIWQLLHPTGKFYSYFFPIHHCHWRIDFSLLYSNLFQFILDCSMWNILISYHTAIQLRIPFLTCHQGNSIACFP